MIDDTVLLWTALVLLAAGVAVIGTWLAHGVWTVAAGRRFAARRPAVLGAVAGALQGYDPGEARARLETLSNEQRIEVLVSMSLTVSGRQRRVIQGLASSTGVMSDAERWARSRRWDRRLRAARLLTYFGSGEEAAGEALLRDPDPDVRAQAAEWAGEHPTPERLELLAAMLADPSPRCRFFAGDALVHAGSAALRPLLARFEDGEGDGVTTAELLAIAAALATPAFAPAAEAAMRSPDAAVRAQGAALAAAVGGSDSADQLSQLLGDPDPAVRGAAARGLGQLGHWRAAAPVAALLSDGEWHTRNAAAAALGRMGPTGELLLRRAARDAGPTGAAAKHALQVAP